MNEGQFKAIISQFAAIQARIWRIVETFKVDASEQPMGPLLLERRRIQELLLEVCKWEGMLEEAERQVSFLCDLRAKADARPAKKTV